MNEKEIKALEELNKKYNCNYDDLKELIIDNDVLDDSEIIHSCDVIENEEDRANQYFHGDEFRTDNEWTVNKLNLEEENLYIVHSNYEGFKGYFFNETDGIDFAIKEINNPKTIEEEIDDFISIVGGGYDVEINPERNNGGHFHSYNVYKDGDLIYDGAFSLTEELAEELIEIDTVLGISDGEISPTQSFDISPEDIQF